MTDALFDVPELRMDPDRRGRAEAGLMRALDAAEEAGKLLPEYAGLVGGALIAARGLDRAENLPDKSAVYAIAQLMRPYQDALHALGLPVAVTPVPPPVTASSQTAPSDWLGDAFGTPGD